LRLHNSQHRMSFAIKMMLAAVPAPAD